MNDFTPIPSLAGGALIGLAASLLVLTHGKVAGISGIFGGLLSRGADARGFRLAFLAGLVGAGALARAVAPQAFATKWSAPIALLFGAGVLVGFGTRLAGGCTSGHGVCGLSRGSARSLVATLVFMLTGGLTVWLVRHVFGGMS